MIVIGVESKVLLTGCYRLLGDAYLLVSIVHVVPCLTHFDNEHLSLVLLVVDGILYLNLLSLHIVRAAPPTGDRYGDCYHAYEIVLRFIHHVVIDKPTADGYRREVLSHRHLVS